MIKRIDVLFCGGPFQKEDLKKALSTSEDVEVSVYSTDENYDPSSIKIIVGYKVDKVLLDSLPNLKLVHVPFAGVDILDLSIFYGRNIYISNSHTNAKAVAEFAVSLLFSLVKKIPEFDRYMRKGVWKGRWERERLDDFMDRSVTILGFGAIGKEISKMLAPFGMHIRAIKRNIYEEDKKFLNILEGLGTQERLLEFLEKSDYLIVSLPLTRETHEIIGEKEMDALGRKGFIVNISRGKVINEEILFRRLKENRLRGAALDVWWVYPRRANPNPYPAHFPFWELDNVIMTPHTAGFTKNFVTLTLKETVEIIKNMANDILPSYIIDITREY